MKEVMTSQAALIAMLRTAASLSVMPVRSTSMMLSMDT